MRTITKHLTTIRHAAVGIAAGGAVIVASDEALAGPQWVAIVVGAVTLAATAVQVGIDAARGDAT